MCMSLAWNLFQNSHLLTPFNEKVLGLLQQNNMMMGMGMMMQQGPQPNAYGMPQWGMQQQQPQMQQVYIRAPLTKHNP